MGYAILRVQKLKSPVAVRRSMLHTFREQDTPNADPQHTPDNAHFGTHNVAEGMAAFNAALPDKIRSNAVLAVEYLITASPETMNAKDRAGQDRYFADALDWLKTRHGAANVVHASIHRDETTPHLVAYVVPRDPDTGRLNCRRWLGGAKALSQMQTDFAQNVGQQHGFQRGIEHSRAKHTTIREFYGALNQPEHVQGRIEPEDLTPKVLEKRLFSKDVETPEAVAGRITAGVQKFYGPALAEAATARLDRRKADEAIRTVEAKGQELRDAQKRVRELESAFGGLKAADLQDLVNQAATKREEHRVEVEKQRRVDQLASLVKKATSATKTFAQHAIAAIKAQAGQWRFVDWGQVEGAAVREHVQVNGKSKVDAVNAVLDHSPGQAAMPAKAAAAVLERAAAEDKAAGRKPEREQSRGQSR
jgi:hypothetical protein